MSEFDKVFTDRILFVTEGKSKDWEEGYNTMVIATKLLLEEIKLHIESNFLPLSTLKQVIEESINHFKKEPNYGKYTGYEVATILSDVLTAITKLNKENV